MSPVHTERNPSTCSGQAISIQFKTRRAHASDADAIAEAHIDSIRSIGPEFYPPDSVKDWGEGLDGSVYVNAMKSGEVFFVATGDVDGKPSVLGFSTHYVHGGRHGTGVYVRGAVARHGVGSALFALAEADAIASGATSIHIESSLAGVEFYKVRGFEEVSRGDTRLRSGRPIACVFMRKTLRQ